MAKNTELYNLSQSLRIALTGGVVSEPIAELLAVMGKELVIQRIQEEIQRLREIERLRLVLLGYIYDLVIFKAQEALDKKRLA